MNDKTKFTMAMAVAQLGIITGDLSLHIEKRKPVADWKKRHFIKTLRELAQQMEETLE